MTADTINYIEIDGYFHFLFEDVGVYPSKNSNSPDALSLDFDSSFDSHVKELQNLSGKFVSITGVLGNANGLYKNVYNKTLYQVICIKEK